MAIYFQYSSKGVGVMAITRLCLRMDGRQSVRYIPRTYLIGDKEENLAASGTDKDNECSLQTHNNVPVYATPRHIVDSRYLDFAFLE